MSTHCVGRFQFTVPDVLAVAGRSQSIYRVEVGTVSLPAGGVEALWHELLTRIRALNPPAGTRGPVVRTFELQPGVSAVWYFVNSDDSELRELEALKPEAEHAVVASRGGMAGQEAGVETLVKNVLDAYAPSVAQGFCVGRGAITSEPGLNEHALIAFEHRELPDFELTFGTQTVSEPDTRSYSNLDEEQQVVAALGGRMSALRDGARVVAGLDGKEIWITVVPRDEAPFVRFTWHFAGVPEDSLRPSINIKGSTTTNRQAELEAVWETLLQSLRAVPLSPVQAP